MTPPSGKREFWIHRLEVPSREEHYGPSYRKRRDALAFEAEKIGEFLK